MMGAIQANYAAVPSGTMPNFVFGNHDLDRLATRCDHQSQRSVGTLLLTLWGIPG